ncbi:MAG: hypothetical protein K0R30_2814, partial [Ornithinibacter sp.]|nr:hypothetical protein [Ornithinibacter sp.]
GSSDDAGTSGTELGEEQPADLAGVTTA